VSSAGFPRGRSGDVREKRGSGSAIDRVWDGPEDGCRGRGAGGGRGRRGDRARRGRPIPARPGGTGRGRPLSRHGERAGERDADCRPDGPGRCGAGARTRALGRSARAPRCTCCGRPGAAARSRPGGRGGTRRRCTRGVAGGRVGGERAAGPRRAGGRSRRPLLRRGLAAAADRAVGGAAARRDGLRQPRARPRAQPLPGGGRRRGEARRERGAQPDRGPAQRIGTGVAASRCRPALRGRPARPLVARDGVHARRAARRRRAARAVYREATSI
jgi:hypothetical protein